MILLLLVVYEIIANSDSRTLNLCALVVNESHLEGNDIIKESAVEEV